MSDRQLRQVLKRTHRQQERITEALEALAPLPGLLAEMQTRLDATASQPWVKSEIGHLRQQLAHRLDGLDRASSEQHKRLTALELTQAESEGRKEGQRSGLRTIKVIAGLAALLASWATPYLTDGAIPSPRVVMGGISEIAEAAD